MTIIQKLKIAATFIALTPISSVAFLALVSHYLPEPAQAAQMASAPTCVQGLPSYNQDGEKIDFEDLLARMPASIFENGVRPTHATAQRPVRAHVAHVSVPRPRPKPAALARRAPPAHATPQRDLEDVIALEEAGL